MTANADHVEVTVSRNSRRAVLIGALSGIGAWAAGTVSGIARVRAADNDPMLVGTAHTGSLPTTLTNSTNNNNVFKAVSANEGTAIFAESNLGTGVFANCGEGVAVFANTNGLEAVVGQSDSDTSAAVRARSGTNTMTGVLAVSGNGNPPVRTKTGVHGFADQDGTSRGVIGESPAGQGVRGETTTGAALYGTADSGYAVRGSGRLRFDRVSGVARINAGSTSVVVSPGVNVVTATFALLTPKTNIGTRSLWFTTNTTANTLTIHMSASRSSGTFVAWLLVG